ncbi:MAG: SDR family NAD(P)-dependent oxidoreductase, partial [Rubripirellula sp.]
QSRWGGYVDGIDRFDPQLLGISPKEASGMDPQQRMLLEVAWRAFEDAGQPLQNVAGKDVSVYVGISSFDYAVAGLSPQDRGVVGSYNNTGGSSSIAANRISYCFDLRGPSVAIDTACSSSLVALHLACESLRRGESDMALCGGVNALILPDFYVAFSQLGVLSPDGRCKTFDARANGYVRSEGAGMVLLKPLDKAIADNDSIYCVIRGTAINQDGHTKGLTVPSGDAQRKLVRTACEKAGVKPADIQYVETHGTGTPVGDPIEANALGDTLGESRDEKKPCLIGSVKTNIGHLEAGAGIASLIKVALSLHHGKVPAHLHLQNPNPEIDFEALKLRVPNSTEAWPESSGQRLAGINGFGYGGANAHVILQDAPTLQEVDSTNNAVVPVPTNRRAYVLPISGKSPAALGQAAGQMADWLESNADGLAMEDIAASAWSRQNHFGYRGAVAGETLVDWIRELRTVQADSLDKSGTASRGSAKASRSGDDPGVLFVCCGQGPQWWAMGRELYEANPVYRGVIDRCDEAFRKHVDWSLKDELQREQSESRLHETSIAQPALFALQVALGEAWGNVGVRPTAIVGHSVGEIAAAHLSGALSFEDACCVAIERGRTMDLASSSGAMIAAGISAQEARQRIEVLGIDVALAAINGPSSVTISGKSDAIEELALALEEAGVFCKRLAVEYAFHSAQMDPVRDELLRVLSNITPQATKIDLISTVTGDRIDGECVDANYWWRNVRESVNFTDAMTAVGDAGYQVVVELGPHPVLAYAIDECFHDTGRSVHVAPSMRRDVLDHVRFAESLASLYNAGVDLDWEGVHPVGSSTLRLPVYPFQHQSLWLESRESAITRISPWHPLLGGPTDHPTPAWQSRLELGLQSSLRDHRVRGNSVLPAAAMVEIALTAARKVKEAKSVTLRRVQFNQACLLSDETPLHLETQYNADRRQIKLSVREVEGGQWSSLASAEVLDAPAELNAIATSLDDVKRRCTSEIDPDVCYGYCAELGLDYGEEFRGLAGGWRRDGESLADVVLMAKDDADGYQHGIHPALLDGCFHSMIAADPNYKHLADGLYLPREMGRVEFLRPAGERVRVHTRVLEKTRHRFVADLDIYDEQGDACIRIRGFVSQRVNRSDAEESIRDWLYCYRWTESPLAEERIVAVGPESSPVWCVLADSVGVADEMVSTLSRAGETVIRVDHGAAFQRVGAGHYVLNPERLEDFQAFLKQAMTENDSRPVNWVYLWGLDAPDMTTIDCDSLEQSAHLTSVAPLMLVQAWDSWGHQADSQCALVTMGAQTQDETMEAVSVAQMPLIGFGRVVISEFGAFRSRLIDLPMLDSDAANPNAFSKFAGSLIAELSNAADSEDEVMYRSGVRYAHRFVAQFDQPLPPDTRTSVQSRLEIGNAYGIDDLRYRSMAVEPLEDDCVEIEVAATGLNFSDVMKALNLYPGLEDGVVNLGAECSGRITRVGEGVTKWSVGDEVIAIAPGSFATHAVVSEALIAAKPRNLTHEQAAAIPIAFLTAAHALEDCARIREGETVLIHSASGGVGLAAIQIAKNMGATIFATAGNDEKREFVRQQGAAKVMDSRSLKFADEIAEETGGEGIDAILNSLPGEAIARGLASLKVGGRFLEIGKRDIYEDGSLGMYPLRNNLAFFAIDLDQLFKQQPQRMGEMLATVVEKFESGEYQPLPTRSWDVEETDGAFRFMQQAKHIGKVAIEYPQRPATVFCGSYDDVRFRADGTYWIVGGLGGFGLEVARWFGQRGAGTLVLSGRTDRVSEEAREVLAELESLGVTVRILPTDATNPGAVEAALKTIDAELPPLRGVIHSAMVLEDRLLVDLDRVTLDRVLRPKMLGGWNLHAATVERDLDHFILFSSLSSVFGHAGQANYSAANALLDGLAHYRRSQGLPATVINWGHLGEVGYLAKREELGDRLKRQGVRSFSVKQAFDSLEYALQSQVVQMSVLRMDWSLWRGLGITGEVSPRFAHLIHRRSGDDVRVASADEIRDANPARRQELVDDLLRFKVGSLLGFADGQLDTSRSLLELGLDSLMAVELRNWIESQIKITLPIAQLMRDGSLSDLVIVVWELVAEGSDVTAEMEPTVETAGDESRIDSDEAQDLLAALPQLPPEEVSLLLAQMLREQDSASDDAS